MMEFLAVTLYSVIRRALNIYILSPPGFGIMKYQPKARNVYVWKTDYGLASMGATALYP